MNLSIVQFTAQGKSQTVSIKGNRFVDYVTDEKERVCRLLLNEKVLTKKEKTAALSADMGKIMKHLVGTGRASPHQVADIKEKLFFEGLQNVIGQEVEICVDLSTTVEKWFHATQSVFADKVFHVLEKQPPSSFQNLVDEHLMDFSIKKTAERVYLPEVNAPYEYLKEGLKISNIKSGKYFPSSEEFYVGLFYIFLKGGVFIAKLFSDREHKYILERYKRLSDFLKNNEPKKVFQFMGALSAEAIYKASQEDPDKIAKIYRSFMTFNHVDKMPPGLSTEIIDYINSVSSQIKQCEKILTERETQEAREREHKDKQALEVMEAHKKQKMCQDFLEKGKFKEGFQILSTISEKIMNAELKCKLLYLWIAFKKPSVGIEESKQSKFFHDISIAPPQLRKTALYFYVMGLFYISSENETKAATCFKHAQLYDLSFKPAYKALKEAMLLQNKKKSKAKPTWKKTG